MMITLFAAADLIRAFNTTLIITLGAVVVIGCLFVRRFL